MVSTSEATCSTVSERHSKKRLLILSTCLAQKSTYFNAFWSEKRKCGRWRTEDPITIVSSRQREKAYNDMSRLSQQRVTLRNDLHSPKASKPMLLIERGMTIERRKEQP